MSRTIPVELEPILGKSIAEFCPQGFHDHEANHCAHLVSHLAGYQFGYLCHHIAGSDLPGVSVRVQEIFPHCPEVGDWEDRPVGDDDLLVFITARRHVDLGNKTIQNVPKKHIGILRGRYVYHYSNGDDEVVRHTPDALRSRFRRAYRDETVDLFYGTLPEAGRDSRSWDQTAVPEVDLLRGELISIKERIEDLLDSSPASSDGIIPKANRSRRSSEAGHKLAIVVGHTARAPGAPGLPPVAPHEYPWNLDLSRRIQRAASGVVECEVFLRDGIGIAGAYRQAAQWGATAVIELHYNNGGGDARGTETLFGPACSRSEPWAGAIQSSLVRLYDRQGRLDRGIKQAPPHPRGGESVNALSGIPSCLIEPFFGDNESDARLGEQKKDQLAKTLVDTFQSHFSPAAGPAGGPISGRPKATRSTGNRNRRPSGPSSPAITRPAYEPPSSSRRFIEDIDLSPSVPFDPGDQLAGLTELRIIGDGVVFLDSDLSTDADGSPRAPEIDRYGQLETAYNFSNQAGQHRYVNAEIVPYVVLPGSNHPDRRPQHEYLYRRLGLRLGDLAAVIWRDRIEFAFLADAGPNDHIGEGSIALVESLGWDPWNSSGTRIVSGIPGPGVLTFFFPQSRLAGLTPQNVIARIRERGSELFRSIGGTIS